jgi:hypothetical protein
MKGVDGNFSRRGFALVLMLVLVALLVLALSALGVLVRVNGQISAASSYRSEARQNALVGLAQAIGGLQTLAGPDDRVTAMAGTAGAPGGSQKRHWCGVWDGGGNFLGWLTSGAENSLAPGVGFHPAVQLVGKNSVGEKPATTNAYVDEEYVDAGKIPLVVPRPGGGTEVRGAYAFWVGDEGVKVSAWASAAQWPPEGVRIAVASTPVNVARIGAAFQQFDVARAARVIAYEQAIHLSYAAGGQLKAANLRDGFHHVTLTHRSVAAGAGYFVGRVNINTTSEVVWRSLIESYEAAPGAKPFGSPAKRTQAIRALANGLSSDPFTSVEAFLTSGLLASAFGGKNGITPDEFAAVMTPMLTVRSDTFRVRAYGEAVNRADSNRLEAQAYCEAIVQRTPELASLSGTGRAFRILYFRWLGPGDI